MTPLERMADILTDVAALLKETKASMDTLSVLDAHRLYSETRQAEAWLHSVRTLLEPPGVL